MRIPRDLSSPQLVQALATAILSDVAEHFGMSRSELVERLFGPRS